MVLEWLRRHDAVIDKQLRTYLFTEAPVTEVEAHRRGRRRCGGRTERRLARDRQPEGTELT